MKTNKFAVLAILCLLAILVVLAPAGNECGSSSPCTCGVPCQDKYEPQAHGYNTIDDCTDGSNPKYEWVQDLNVTDINQTTFMVGTQISIDVTYKCDYGEGDEISINYNNGSGWEVVQSGSCNVNAYIHFKKNITLDKVVGTHAIRGVIAWSGVTTGMICGHDYDTTYSDTDDVTFQVLGLPDSVPPSVVLRYSQNNHYVNTHNVDLNFSAFDNGTIRNCSVWLNSSGIFKRNTTITNVLNNLSLRNNIKLNLADGTYKWNINCFDFNGNSGWYENNYTFSLDATRPSLYFLHQTPANGAYLNRTSIVINVSFSDTHNLSLKLEWNGTNQSSAFSFKGNSIWTSAKTSLAGTYSFRVFGVDSFNNSNSTQRRTVVLDTVAPQAFDLTLPSNNTKATLPAQMAPTLNWSDSGDSYFKNYTVEVSSSPSFAYRNYTYGVVGPAAKSEYVVTSNWLDKTTWYWRVIAYDFVGNSRKSQNSFVYITNSTYPWVTLTSPQKNSFSRASSISFSYLPQAVNLKSCELWHNASGAFVRNMTNTSPVSGVQNFFKNVSLPQGSMKWNVLCNNTIGQQAWAASYNTLFVDRTAPAVSFDSDTPAEASTYNGWTIPVAVDIQETNYGYVIIEWNRTNQSASIYNSSYFLDYVELQSDGYYKFKVYVNDSAGNKNATQMRTIFVDTTPPSMSNYAVSPRVGLPNRIFNITVVATDPSGVSAVDGIFNTPDEIGIAYPFTGGPLWYNEFNATFVGNYAVHFCASDIFDQETCSDVILNFTADDSSIEIANLTFNPDTTDQLDPNVKVTVNASIHSSLNVSSALLRFKESNSSSWSKVAMEHSGPKYYANFTPNRQNSYIFMVWVNNSAAKSNWTQTQNISVFYDYTWTFGNYLRSIAAKFGKLAVSLGNISINNTGDYPLIFNVSQSSGSVHVSINSTDLLVLQPMKTSTVLFSADAPLVSGTYPIDIKVDAINGNAQPGFRMLNVTLVSYSSGPYILVSIVDYDNTVHRGDNVPVMKAKLDNIGNESCSNSQVVWSLPTGWSSRDSLNISLGTIGFGATAWNNISADVGASAPLGDAEIIARLYCSDGQKFNDTRIVTVATTGSQPSTPQQPSGGAAGGSVVTKFGYMREGFDINIEAPDKVVANIGKYRKFNVTIKNLEKDLILTNLNISISGYYLIHTTINPINLGRLEQGKSALFSVMLDIPSYLSARTYPLTIELSATGYRTNIQKAVKVSVKKNVALEITLITKVELLSLINSSKDKIDKLRNMGIDVKELEGMLQSSYNDLNISEYNSAKSTLDQINSFYESAIAFTTELTNIQSKIEASKKNGLNVSAAEGILVIAKKEFYNGNIAQARELLSKALFAERIQAKTEQAKFVSRVGWFVRTHWLILLLITFVLSAAGIVVSKQVQIAYVESELRHITRKEQLLYGLMQKAQREHFVDKITSEGLYARTMAKLQEEIAELHYKRIKLYSKKKGNSIKTVEEQISYLKSVMKDLHYKYYIERTITEKAFLQLSNLCEAKISESNQRKTILEKSKFGKPKKEDEQPVTDIRQLDIGSDRQFFKDEQQPTGHGILSKKAKDYLQLVNGNKFDTLAGLLTEISKLNKDQLSHHVNTMKNDFAVWLRYSLEEPILADLVESKKSIEAIKKVIEHYAN